MHEWASVARRNGAGRCKLPIYMDPKDVRVLVIDSKSSSRQNISTLLRDCQYQVTTVKTSKEALGLLRAQAADAQWAFDLILKDHEPPQANACRLLRKLASHEVLRQIPVVVVSSQDERDLVARCLSLGAAEYLVKPLRHNELRNIWTKIWWWQKVASSGALPGADFTPGGLELGYLANMSQGSSTASEETKCEDEEEPTSKEGSAPDGNGHGSNGNGSNSGNGNGSKEGNGTSRVEAKVHAGSNNGNGNGSSDNKNGNGNSATKNGHNGSNGNGASTTLLPERPGSGALVGTAEGGLVKPPENGHEEHEPPKPSMGWGAFTQYTGPITSSRKRPASEVAKEGREEDINSNPPLPEAPPNKPGSHRDRAQLRSSAGGGSTPSTHTASEDTTHPSQHPNPNIASLRFARDNPGSNPTAFPQHPSKLSMGVNSSFSVPPSSWPPQFSALAAQAQAQAQSLSGQNPFQTLPYPYGLSPQMLHSLAFFGSSSSTAAAGHLQHNVMEGMTQQSFSTLQPNDCLTADAANARAGNVHNAQHHNRGRPWEAPAPAASLEAIHQQQQQQHHQHMMALYNMSAALYGLQQQSHQQLHGNQAHPSHTSHATHPPHPAHPSHSHHHHTGGPHMQSWQLPQHHPPFQHSWNRQVPTQSASNGQATAPAQSVQMHPLSMMPPQQLPMIPVSAQQQQQQQQPLQQLQPQQPQPAPSRQLPPAGPPPLEGAVQTSAAGGETGSRSRGGVGPRAQSDLSRRRAIALDKYRQKRKNLKFSKTIRYETRKQLAQNRPRIKGQFVKRTGLDSEDGHGTDDGHRLENGNGHDGTIVAGSAGYWQRSEDRTGNSQADTEDEESRGTPFEHGRQGNHLPAIPMEEEEEEEEYDQDEEDEMDEEDMEEEAKEGRSEGGAQEAPVDDDVEMDVVNSLCELRESAPAHPVAQVDQEGLPQQHTHCDQSSPTGSHSHRIHSPGGSHSHRVPSSRAANFPFPPQAARPGPEVHSISVNGGRVSSCSALPAVQSASNGNGKNGSDSGSNSPDENGQGEPTMTQGQGTRQRNHGN